MNETSEVSNDINEGTAKPVDDNADELGVPAESVSDDTGSEVEDAELGPGTGVPEGEEVHPDGSDTPDTAVQTPVKGYSYTPLLQLLNNRYTQASEYIELMSKRYSQELKHLEVFKVFSPVSEWPEGTTIYVYDWNFTPNLHIRTLWDPGLIGEIEKKFITAGWVEDYTIEPTDTTPSFEVRFVRTNPAAEVVIIFDAQKEHSMCRLEDTGELTTRVVEETVHKYRIICD